MALIRIIAKHIKPTVLLNPILGRSIAMSSVRQQQQTEEAVEQLKSKNPFYERYAAKLAALQQAAPEEFLEKVTKVVKPQAAPKPVEKPRWFKYNKIMFSNYLYIYICVIQQLLGTAQSQGESEETRRDSTQAAGRSDEARPRPGQDGRRSGPDLAGVPQTEGRPERNDSRREIRRADGSSQEASDVHRAVAAQRGL